MRRPPIVLSVLAVTAGLLVGVAPADATVAPTPAQLSSVAAGTSHTVMIGANGKPYGAGRNEEGQLTGTPGADVSVLTQLSGLPTGVTAIAVNAAGNDTLVLGSDHVLYGSGQNVAGGLTGTGARSTLTPLTGQPADKIVDMDSAGDGTLALSTNGNVYYTGLDRSARFANLGSATTLTALPLPGSITATDIAVSFENSYIVGSDDKVYGLGANTYGNGPGVLTGAATTTFTEMVLPTLGPLPAEAVRMQIDASGQDVVVVAPDGLVYGRGQNLFGEIGQGNAHTTFSAMTGMPPGTHATAVTESNYYTIAIGSDGRLYGAGNTTAGRLPGYTGTDQYQWSPIAAGLGNDAKAVAATGSTTIVADAEGIVRGSGSNNRSQLTTGASGYADLRALSGQPLVNRTPPKILGTPQFTKTLTVDPGTWNVVPSDLRYVWTVDGGAIIADAKGPTLVLDDSHPYVGNRITVQVTAKRGPDGVFVDAVATSAATVRITAGPALLYTATSKPTITGTLKAGRTLSISKTSSTLKAGFTRTALGMVYKATDLKYQWYRSGSKVSGRTGSTYKLGTADKGRSITVRIYGLRENFTTGSYLTKSVKVAR